VTVVKRTSGKGTLAFYAARRRFGSTMKLKTLTMTLRIRMSVAKASIKSCTAQALMATKKNILPAVSE
jgi:hypothetical protein